MFICSKLRQNLSEMELRTFERIERVIWDHLLPFKGEIIQKQQSWTEVVETHDNDQLFFPWCEFSPLPS